MKFRYSILPEKMLAWIICSIYGPSSFLPWDKQQQHFQTNICSVKPIHEKTENYVSSWMWLLLCICVHFQAPRSAIQHVSYFYKKLLTLTINTRKKTHLYSISNGMSSNLFLHLVEFLTINLCCVYIFLIQCLGNNAVSFHPYLWCVVCGGKSTATNLLGGAGDDLDLLHHLSLIWLDLIIHEPFIAFYNLLADTN